MSEELRAIRAQESIADEVYAAHYASDESDDSLDASDAFVYAMLDIA
jgi:hypothetical protein